MSDETVADDAKEIAPLFPEAARVTVDGDARSGWIVEIHDGDHMRVFSPEADTAKAAAEAGVALMTKLFPEAMTDRPLHLVLPEGAEDDVAVDGKVKPAEPGLARKKRGDKKPTVDGQSNA